MKCWFEKGGLENCLASLFFCYGSGVEKVSLFIQPVFVRDTVSVNMYREIKIVFSL